MTDQHDSIPSQTEIHASQVSIHPIVSAANANDNAASAAASTPALRPPAVPASLAPITRLFRSSGLRKPSKLPRLSKQQMSVSVSSAAADAQAPKRGTATATASRALSVASGVSPRETTPFGSPVKAAASRLREPKQHMYSRKRSRDEMTTTSSTIASVAERLTEQDHHHHHHHHRHGHRQVDHHSEDLTVSSSQTTHDDATSSTASTGREEEDQSETSEEAEQRRAREITVARAVQRDLVRDRAKLRLKINALKEDVEVYYELLARMEQAVVAVRARARAADSATPLDLSKRILAIISAKRTDHCEAEANAPTETKTETEQLGGGDAAQPMDVRDDQSEHVEEY